MTMSRAQRKLSLTAHIAASVGWLGTVAAAFVLAVAGAWSGSERTARAAYDALELIAWYAILPLACLSLLTGLVQSLGTTWGLFRHYWVIAKLTINLFATIVLLLYTRTLDALAAADDVSSLERASPVIHAGAALALLLLATGFAVYKPRGLTPYGWRKRDERHAASDGGPRRD